MDTLLQIIIPLPMPMPVEGSVEIGSTAAMIIIGIICFGVGFAVGMAIDAVLINK